MLNAKLTEIGAPVLNAKITGSVVGQNTTVESFDDGKHGDAAANDEIYGATVEKLAKGECFIEAKAETSNQTKFAAAPITVWNAATSIKTAAKPRRGK